MDTIINTFRVGRASPVNTIRTYGVQRDARHTPDVAAKKTNEAVLCGQRIRQCMTDKGWTQADLARMAKLTPSRLGNYLQGLRELGIREAMALSKVLAVPAAYLLGVADDLDRDVLNTSPDQKRSFLALLGQDRAKEPTVLEVRHLKRG